MERLAGFRRGQEAKIFLPAIGPDERGEKVSAGAGAVFHMNFTLTPTFMVSLCKMKLRKLAINS